MHLSFEQRRVDRDANPVRSATRVVLLGREHLTILLRNLEVEVLENLSKKFRRGAVAAALGAAPSQCSRGSKQALSTAKRQSIQRGSRDGRFYQFEEGRAFPALGAMVFCPRLPSFF